MHTIVKPAARRSTIQKAGVEIIQKPRHTHDGDINKDRLRVTLLHSRFSDSLAVCVIAEMREGHKFWLHGSHDFD